MKIDCINQNKHSYWAKIFDNLDCKVFDTLDLIFGEMKRLVFFDKTHFFMLKIFFQVCFVQLKKDYKNFNFLMIFFKIYDRK